MSDDRFAQYEHAASVRESARAASTIVIPEATEYAAADPTVAPEFERAEERRQEALLARRSGVSVSEARAKMAEALSQNGEPTSRRDYHIAEPMNAEPSGVTLYGSHGLRCAVVNDDGSRDVTFLNWVV